LSNPICVTEKLPDLTVFDENSTIDEIQVKLFIETLPEDDKQIVCMLMEGYSISKISKILSSSHQKISDKQIKKKLQSIQTLFV
jgi:transposase-like protein